MLLYRVIELIIRFSVFAGEDVCGVAAVVAAETAVEIAEAAVEPAAEIAA